MSSSSLPYPNPSRLRNLGSGRPVNPLAVLSASPVVECLEPRRLLAAGGVVAAVKGGMLRVRGTGGDDVIRLALNAADRAKLDVFVAGAPDPLGTFDLANMPRGYRVDGGRGNDQIRADEANGPVALPGGAPLKGTLRGGAGNDVLVGGSGDDLLDGAAGDDAADGGPGRDRLRGGGGDDQLAGGEHDDALWGGKGTDSLTGGPGDDALRGDAGNDALEGGDGVDLIDGGKGIDQNRGGPGEDTFGKREKPEEIDQDGPVVQVQAPPPAPPPEPPPAPPPEPPPTPRPQERWRLVWGDEFDGTQVDSEKWEVADRSQPNYDGGVNSYDPENVSVEDGRLVIRSRDHGPSAGDLSERYSSGRVKMNGAFLYGRIEVRAKMPAGKGMWPAIWLLPRDGSWPPEVDLAEVLGDDPNTVHMTHHWGTGQADHQFDQDSFTGPDFSADFHTFTLEWEPGRLRWLIDGVERRVVTDHVPRVPMYLRINTSVGGDWPGLPDEHTAFPQQLQVYYVRVYQEQPAG